ncbi:MAG: hypothetical protein WD534_10355 [Phycisphaeraceae bacterium]
MNHAPGQPGQALQTPPVERFPLMSVLAWMTGVAGVIGGGLVWLAPQMFASEDAQRAVMVGGLTAYGVMVVSLVPVALLASWGMMAIVAAYFAGAGLRIVGCLAVVAAALVWWELPAGPLVLGLGLYVPLLLLETGLIGRHLWRKDGLVLPATGNPPANKTEPSP